MAGLELHLNDLIGIPFLKNGRTLQGLDCYGLVIEVYKRLGFEAVDINSPLTEKEVDCVIDENKEELTVKLDAPKPYCLVTLKDGIYVCHIGVVLDDCTRFIHTTSRRGFSTIERLDNLLWKQKIKEFREWKNFNL